MAACEWCWAHASMLAATRTASVAEIYREVFDSQQAAGKSAQCPEARSYAAELGGES